LLEPTLLLKRLSLPLFALIGALTFFHYQHSMIAHWYLGFSWLSYAGLIIAGLIAAQFGRSRIVVSSLLWLVLLLAGNDLIPSLAEHKIILLSGTMLVLSWLLWRKDKGLLPLNALATLSEILLIAFLVYGYFIPLSQFADKFFTPLSQLVYGVFPHFSALVSPFELVLFPLALLLGLLRVILQPSNNHVALYITLVVIIVNLLSANSANQQLIANLSGLGLACYYVVAVLIDSFNMAFRDELSGIPSRRALMQFVQTLGRKYVVVMADIDHFKKFNDTYGHDVGDQVLKLVASQLNKVSGGGRAFRYGGEEFTLVFPRKTINEVIPHVEVLRRNIADYAIALRGQDRPKHPPKKGQSRKVAKPKTVSVTCSFGVAERSAEINDFTKILKQADVALYAAKKVGRNCVQQA
jgi:diguanylate cyclase (GGDEF)-like protein